MSSRQKKKNTFLPLINDSDKHTHGRRKIPSVKNLSLSKTPSPKPVIKHQTPGQSHARLISKSLINLRQNRTFVSGTRTYTISSDRCWASVPLGDLPKPMRNNPQTSSITITAVYKDSKPISPSNGRCGGETIRSHNSGESRRPQCLPRVFLLLGK